LPQDAPLALKIAARTNHVLLYVAPILQPLLIVSPYSGGSEGWAGLVHMPLPWAIIVLVVLHAAGALCHGSVHRGGILQRMLSLGLTGR
jgi:cytochrome b561